MPSTIELGLDTFGDVSVGDNGALLSQAQTLRNLVEQGVLADQVGLSFIGLGEHHRPDFSVSAPEVMLAAIAARTTKIHLGSAVTVLNSDDPIRVFQRFSTLNAISSGRAEVLLGRGSFTESFPLFGLDLRNYEALFEEKLEIFAALARHSEVTWNGEHRPPLENQKVYPPIESGELRTWIAVGGTPQSVVRAAYYGFPLMLAIIGGSAARFAPFADLYKRASEKAEKQPGPVGCHSPGHVGATDAEALNDLWPHYEGLMNRIGWERGWPPTGRAHFEREAGPDGALYCGSPETVARKIAATAKALGLSRFDLKYANGTMPHGKLMKSIELFGTKVVPLVREMLA